MAQVGVVKKKGDYVGAIVRAVDDMVCPRYIGLDGKVITIVQTNQGEILAVKDSEVTWLPTKINLV
jgi:hypothetical protein